MISKKLEELYEESVRQADYGRILWKKMLQEYKIASNERVIAICSEYPEYNESLICMLPTYQEKTGQKRLILLVSDEQVRNRIKQESNNQWVVISLSEEDMESLCILYRLYKFTNQLIINRFCDTTDANPHMLVGVNGITVNDIIATAVLGLV